jgi:hypothetical protein
VGVSGWERATEPTDRQGPCLIMAFTRRADERQDRGAQTQLGKQKKQKTIIPSWGVES